VITLSSSTAIPSLARSTIQQAWPLVRQQPDGGETPGVGLAPVALAGAIMVGFARSIVTLWPHAVEFGVGTTARFGSMLVVASSVIADRIVPGGVSFGISAVDSGKTAPVIGGPPGSELHTTVGWLPTGGAGATVPVELTPIGVRMVPNGVAGIIVVDAGIVAAEVGVIVAVAPPIADMEVIGTAGLPDTICGIGVAQLTNVPGVAGLEANGTGANVVTGVPGWVVAENGPGPVSGDVTITPGVVGTPMAVVPMVETCVRLALQPNSKAAAVDSEHRIRIASFDLACLRLAHRDLASLHQIHHRVEDDLVTWFDTVVHFDLGAEVTHDGDLLKMGAAVLDNGDM
jgi:hypothetical protein